jgi:hypothetical protein
VPQRQRESKRTPRGRFGALAETGSVQCGFSGA